MFLHTNIEQKREVMCLKSFTYFYSSMCASVRDVITFAKSSLQKKRTGEQYERWNMERKKKEHWFISEQMRVAANGAAVVACSHLASDPRSTAIKTTVLSRFENFPYDMLYYSFQFHASFADDHCFSILKLELKHKRTQRKKSMYEENTRSRR